MEAKKPTIKRRTHYNDVNIKWFEPGRLCASTTLKRTPETTPVEVMAWAQDHKAFCVTVNHYLVKLHDNGGITKTNTELECGDDGHIGEEFQNMPLTYEHVQQLLALKEWFSIASSTGHNCEVNYREEFYL